MRNECNKWLPVAAAGEQLFCTCGTQKNKYRFSSSGDASTSGGADDDSIEAEFVAEQSNGSVPEHLEDDDDDEEDSNEEFYEDLAFVEIPKSSRVPTAGQPQPGPSQPTKRRTAIQLDDDEDT